MLSETVMEWTKMWKEEGRTEGRAEGQDAERHVFARRLLARDMSVAEVAELSGLTVGEVEALLGR